MWKLLNYGIVTFQRSRFKLKIELNLERQGGKAVTASAQPAKDRVFVPGFTKN